MSALNVLRQSWKVRALSSFHTQLVWELGTRLQNLYKTLLDGECNNVTITAKWVSLSDVFDQDHKLQRALVRYVESGVRTTEGSLHMGLSSDSSSCGSNTLQATLFTIPMNKCIVAIPRVSAVVVASRRLGFV